MDLRSICYDMTAWSHLCVTNVKSVSLPQLNWNSTSQYTPLSSSFAVVYVGNILSIKLRLKFTSGSVFRTCDIDMCVFLMIVFTTRSGVGYAVFTVCMRVCLYVCVCVCSYVFLWVLQPEIKRLIDWLIPESTRLHCYSLQVLHCNIILVEIWLWKWLKWYWLT